MSTHVTAIIAVERLGRFVFLFNERKTIAHTVAVRKSRLAIIQGKVAA